MKIRNYAQLIANGTYITKYIHITGQTRYWDSNVYTLTLPYLYYSTWSDILSILYLLSPVLHIAIVQSGFILFVDGFLMKFRFCVLCRFRWKRRSKRELPLQLRRLKEPFYIKVFSSNRGGICLTLSWRHGNAKISEIARTEEVWIVEKLKTCPVFPIFINLSCYL